MDLIADASKKKQASARRQRTEATKATRAATTSRQHRTARIFKQEGYKNGSTEDFELRYNELRHPTLQVMRGQRGNNLQRAKVASNFLKKEVWDNLASHTSVQLAKAYTPQCRLCRRVYANCMCMCTRCKKALHALADACKCACVRPACMNGCSCALKESKPKGEYRPVDPATMQTWFYNSLLVRYYGGDVKCFYRDHAAGLKTKGACLLPRLRFFTINASVRADINALQSTLRDTFSTFVSPGAEAAIDESMLAFVGDCPFKVYMPRKPHKWGILLYNMCVKLALSRKPFMVDFEPNMSPLAVEDAELVGPCQAMFKLVERAVPPLLAADKKLHLAVDSAFGTEQTFVWLESRATHVTAALAASRFGSDRLEVLTHGLPEDHWRLFHAEENHRTISVLKDRGVKQGSSTVVTMSNAYQRVYADSKPLVPTQPKIGYAGALAMTKLPPDVLMMWCHDVGVTFVPGQPVKTVHNISGFDIAAHIAELWKRRWQRWNAARRCR